MNTHRNSGEYAREEHSSSVHSRRRTKPKRRMIFQTVSGVDRPFLIVVILLLCMGTVMVFDASYPYALEHYGNSYKFALQQGVWALAGVAIMSIVAMFFDYNFIRRFAKVIMGVGILLLIAVLVVGSGAKGAQRWLQIGPITLQPSEIMKFAIVLFFADYADRYAEKIRLKDNFTGILPRFIAAVGLVGMGAVSLFMIDNRILGVIFFLVLLGLGVGVALPLDIKYNLPGFYYGILPYVVILGIVGVLMALQPHISGLVIIAAIIISMMFIGGTHLYYILTGAGAAVAGILAIALGMGHSSARLQVWFNPFDYLREGGWQPVQSLYAIGSGGFWGVGFGNSKQKHLYLPEPQNDYIFSIWCEEMGFIGALVLICIFAFFIYRGIMIGLRAPDRFSSMLVLGIIMHVGIQVILNIAVVTNSLPSTGISLPFFSYGGTSLVILLAEMGVVLSVSRISTVEKT